MKPVLKTLSLFFVAFTVSLASQQVYAMTDCAVELDEEYTKGKEYTISIKNTPPFIMEKNNATGGSTWRGISADLWQLVTNCIGIKTRFVEEFTVDDLVNSVAQKKADFAIAAISMTADREVLVDFSIPYYTSHLGLVVGDNRDFRSLKNLLRQLARSDVLWVLFGLVLFMMTVAFLFWRSESRRKNPLFNEGPLKGMYQSIIWACLLVFSGRGSPFEINGRFGQLFVLFLAFFGVTIVSGGTAIITSSLTIQGLDHSISEIRDLEDKRVFTLSQSLTEQWLKKQDITPRSVLGWSEIELRVDNNELDIFVHDRDIMNYLINQKMLRKVRLLPLKLNPNHYAIAIQDTEYHQPIKEAIDQAIMRLVENGELDQLTKKYLE